VGLQISRGVYPEEAKETDIWSDSKEPPKIGEKRIRNFRQKAAQFFISNFA